MQKEFQIAQRCAIEVESRGELVSAILFFFSFRSTAERTTSTNDGDACSFAFRFSAAAKSNEAPQWTRNLHGSAIDQIQKRLRRLEKTENRPGTPAPLRQVKGRQCPIEVDDGRRKKKKGPGSSQLPFVLFSTRTKLLSNAHERWQIKRRKRKNYAPLIQSRGQGKGSQKAKEGKGKNW